MRTKGGREDGNRRVLMLDRGDRCSLFALISKNGKFSFRLQMSCTLALINGTGMQRMALKKHDGYDLPVVWQLGEHTTAPCRLGMKIRSRISYRT